MIKKVNNYWLVDIQPGGVGFKRYRKRFKKKSDAIKWETNLKAQVLYDSDYTVKKSDKRLLSQLFMLWYTHHGKTLKSGIDTRDRLIRLANHLCDPLALQLNQSMFVQYRTDRLTQGITANCVNREISYARAAFNELKRLGLFHLDNPLDGIRQLKIEQFELSYLTEHQIKDLFYAITQSQSIHLEPVIKLCLATGARWSEALNIQNHLLKNNSITFTSTKSGKNRTIPLPPDLYVQLLTLPTLSSNNKLFTDPVKAYRNALDFIGISLPRGQSTHVLRHTYASHFIMNGGDILTLQKILGHASLDMTLRYAHLSPNHFEQSLKYSPYNLIK
jgi:integrase